MKRALTKSFGWRSILFACAFMLPGMASGEAMLQYFNTSWAEITRRMPELAEAGYTSLWLPPPTKGSGGLSVGYDLWDPFDIGSRDQRGTFATRYGTETELHRLIEIAHRFGIRVYFDNIMNHRAFDVPGYNDFAPPDLYPGMRPEDFHIRRTEDGYYRKWDNVREWWSEWQVQNLGLADLVDIATEPGTTNRNFGAWEGATAEKIKFLRHPNNPDYYCYDANGTYVGFGPNNGLTVEYLQQNEAFYSEYVEDYLHRAVRWLLDRTKADGLRLDAVKHIPADFFGATYGADRDRSNYGYLGQAQEQFNLTRGFSDWDNHRDTVFDTESPRDDAMMFGEHLGEPPAVGDYINAGMRLLDNNLRHHLNSQLGNPWGTLAGMDSPGSHGFSPGSSVMHAQSHDSDYAARRELQHVLYLTRGGIGIVYSDGNHKAGLLKESGGAFPRHANTNFLGQWGDNRIPNLLYFHEHFVRGDQVGRWSDGDVVVYERVDKRDNPGMSDAAGTVGLVMINDNYANGQARGFTTGFPAVGGTDNDAYLYNYSSYGGGFYKYASQLNQVVIPAGGYFLFSWRSPESSDLWELPGGHPLSILQDGEEVGTVSVKRTDGPDGDPSFNPYGVSDDNQSDFTYSWNVPRVTSGDNLKFVVRADGSAENVLLKLDSGLDVNANGQRDNPPALSSDLYLGYEQMNFVGRQGPEKFAARDTNRNMIGSAGAETYWWHADNGSFFTVNGGSGADSYENETAHWVYHDPEQNNDQGEQQFKVTAGSATVWVKVGYSLEVNQARLYHLTDGSNPEGAGGDGIGTTQVTSFAFSHSDGQEPTVDWWKATVPLPATGIFKYKIGVYRNESNGASLASVFPKNAPSVALKKKMLTTFEIDGFNAEAIEYYPHSDYGDKITGLKEGFHFVKGRAFLSRLGEASIYNTFSRTFYYDAKRPEGEITFPGGDGEELFGSEYGFVVRTDPSVDEVLFHVDDNDPTNDDGQTGALNGNGESGDGNSSAWASAVEITSRQDLGATYPKEWRFSYRNIPSGGGDATVRIALREASSSNNLELDEEVGHFRILTRMMKTSGPNHRLFTTWPQRDGDKVGQDYVMKTYLSSTLVDGRSDADIIANLTISIDDSVVQAAPYPSAVAQDVTSAWVERNVAPGLAALAYKLPILRNPEGAPDDFQQSIIVDYKDEGAGVDLRTVRTVTTDFISHGPVNPILKVNEVNADYTSTHLFVDEVKGNEETLEIVLEAPHVTMAEVYTNLNNRDLAAADSNGDGFEDGIQAPDRDSVSQSNNGGYYQVHAMTFDATRGEEGAWVCELKANKTGAYRLTARFKLEDDADVWHWYTSDGRRDHAVVVTPMTARSAIMYELNPLTVDATGDSFATRSTFEDLHDDNRWNLDYLKGMGANWLWFQPIHPRGEDGRENIGGQPYDPGSPYAVKNFFEVMPQLSDANTRTGAMEAFQDFVAAADQKGVNVMVDAPFNHVAWDVELDELGVEIFGSGTAEAEIRSTFPGFFSREDDYGLPARDENEIATAPDRDDFGKWADVKDVYFGNYSALVRGNDPAERNPHQNEEDEFQYNDPDWNDQTRKTWRYFASYVPYWLEKTGLDDGQSVTVQAEMGIDGLRADFGQGLPPQLWEYVINVARARKWSFVFMSEALDGGAVTYRSSRHFDVLNENLLFSLQSATSPGSYREAVENRRAAYGQSLVLLNNVSHDEENYEDPWQAFIRYAAVNAHAGIPMSFMGQELGISRTYGFNYYETNFGKQIPHFKRYNSMQPIWDNNDFGLDQLYKAYASIGRARAASPALRSSHRYFLNELSTDAAHAKIHGVAKWDQPVSSPENSDVVLAFVNLDRDNQQSGTFDLSPGGDEALLGIEQDHLYNVSNLAAFRAEDQDAFLWTEVRSGQDLLDNGIFVMLNPLPNSDEAWATAPYEAQFLKVHDLTTPLLEVNASVGGAITGTGTHAFGADASINAIPEAGYVFEKWVGDGVENPNLAQTTVAMTRPRSVTANFVLDQGVTEIFAEDFSAVGNPTKVSGSHPPNTWFMDDDFKYQHEGWTGTDTDTSVLVVDGTKLTAALGLGWKADNVEVRHYLLEKWDLEKDYVLSGDWEKLSDSGDNHLGFHVLLSEYSDSTGDALVQHVKSLHVNPGNPSVGTTNRFSLTLSALELLSAQVDPSNYIGITFIRSEDEVLHTDTVDGGEWSVKNDTYAIDNLVLVATNSSEVADLITSAVYLSETGDNSNDGRSPSSPWKDFNAVNAQTFGPGAQILFKRGETFTGTMELHGSGTPDNPIIVSAYGEGDKPLLQGGETSREVILITDNEGFEIRGLAFRNYKTNGSVKDRHGINMVPPKGAGDLRHLYFIDLEFKDIQGASADNHNCMGIWGNTHTNDNAAILTRWNDLRIENCRFENIDGRGAQIRDSCHDIIDQRQGLSNYYPTLGFVFEKNDGFNCYRNLLQLRGTKDAVVQFNTMDTTVHGSAVWPFGTDGTLVQFNVFKHLRNPDADCYVCHFDYNCIGTVMQYNYGYDVQGGLIQVLVNSEQADAFQEDAIARYNVGVDVGWRDKDNSAGIHVSGRAKRSKIYNNTIITKDRNQYKAISLNNWGGEYPRYTKIYNNIFYAAGSASTYHGVSQMKANGNLVSHNLYFGNVNPPSGDQNPFKGNPQFANADGIEAEDFKVLHGSLAIGKGLLIANNGARDWFGNMVSDTVAPTIGFHEFTIDPQPNFYVSPSGSDINPGTLAAPWKTIERARDVLRSLTLPDGGTTVWIRGGTYYVDQTIVFDERDSGTASKPIAYKAYPFEEPIFCGGKEITGWTLDSGSVYKAPIEDNNWRFDQLFENGVRKTKARYPNTGYLRTDTPTGSPKLKFKFKPGDLPTWGSYAGAQVSIWNYANWFQNVIPISSINFNTRVVNLSNEAPQKNVEDDRYFIQGVKEELDVAGEFHLDESNGYLYYWPANLPIASQTIVAPVVTNVFEFKGASPSNPVKHVSLEGLTIWGSKFTDAFRDGGYSSTGPEYSSNRPGEDNREGLVQIENASHLTVKNCKLYNAGYCGVNLGYYASHNTVYGNEISDCGWHGVLMAGKDNGEGVINDPAEQIYDNKFNSIDNNHIFKCGRIIGDAAGIFLYQSGDNDIAHNLVHDMPRYGICIKGHGGLYGKYTKFGNVTITDQNYWDFYTGNNNTIRYNHVYGLLKDSYDAGGISLRRPGRYNTISNNRIHDIHTPSSMDHHFSFGIYLDGGTEYTTITKNVIYDVKPGKEAFSAPINMKKVHNTVTNNILVAETGTTGGALSIIAGGGGQPESEGFGYHTVTKNVFFAKGASSTLYRFNEDEFDRNMVAVSNHNLFYVEGGGGHTRFKA